MNNNVNQPTDLAEHSMLRQAKLMDKEIQPERDLWPEIVDKIRVLPQQDFNQPSWMPMALAASILIAVGALGFAGYTNYSVTQQFNPTFVEESTVDLIEKPYLLARASYLTALATEEQAMSPEVREILKKNLIIIDKATQEIRQALKDNPNDQFLTEALLLTRQKELQLLNQVTNRELDTI